MDCAGVAERDGACAELEMRAELIDTHCANVSFRTEIEERKITLL
jgi:hypothetical protein